MLSKSTEVHIHYVYDISHDNGTQCRTVFLLVDLDPLALTAYSPLLLLVHQRRWLIVCQRSLWCMYVCCMYGYCPRFDSIPCSGSLLYAFVCMQSLPRQTCKVQTDEYYTTYVLISIFHWILAGSYTLSVTTRHPGESLITNMSRSRRPQQSGVNSTEIFSQFLFQSSANWSPPPEELREEKEKKNT